MQEASVETLPPIPDKRYFTIGEVSDLCGVKPHVLRYWEQEFTQLKPAKRAGNRRYYQIKDVQLIRKIRSLLYDKGFTITGARQQLEGEADEQVVDEGPSEVAVAESAEAELLRDVSRELKEIIDILR